MKKIKLSLIMLLITVCIMGSVYAALSCNVTANATKTEVTKNEEFSVDFNVADIQSERGVISLQATLEYDKESLELVKMEGKNEWETPTEGASYNPSNGKMAITRGGLGKNDETFLTVTFKVKESSKQNLSIALKNVAVADGTVPAKVEIVSKNITVKDGIENQNPDLDDNQTPSTDIGDGSDNTVSDTVEGNTDKNNANTYKKENQTQNTSTSEQSVKDKKAGILPKAGGMARSLYIILIVLIIVIAVIFFVKVKIIGKRSDK